MTRRRQKDCAQSWSGFVETQGEGTRRMYTFSFISLSMLAYLVVPTVHIIAYLDSPVSQNQHLRPQVLFQIKSATMQIVVKWSTCRREHRHRPFSQFLDRRRGRGCARARARKRGGRRRSGRRKSPRTLTPPLSRKQLFERGSEDGSRRSGRRTDADGPLLQRPLHPRSVRRGSSFIINRRSGPHGPVATEQYSLQ